MIGDVTIQTSFTPAISFNALAVGQGTEHSALLERLKPKISVDLGTGQPLVYSPYGEPMRFGFFFLLVGVVIIVLILKK